MMMSPFGRWNRGRRVHSRRSQAGMIMAVVLVALLVIMMIGAALTNAFLTQRQLARQSRQQQQAFWIAESAMQRAAYRSAQDADYSGETWNLPAEVIDEKQAAVAVIRLKPSSDSDSGREVFVDVSYTTNGVKNIVLSSER